MNKNLFSQHTVDHMKHILIVLFTVCSIGLSYGQQEARIWANWAVGDSLSYHIETTKTSRSAGEAPSEDVSSFNARWRVLDKTAEGYTLAWQSQGSNFAKGLEDLPVDIQNLECPEVIYRTNRKGEFLEIVNHEEVGEFMTNMFNVLFEQLEKEDGEMGGVIRMMMEPMLEDLKTKDAQENYIFSEIRMLHQVQGLQLKSGQKIKMKEALDTDIGNTPLMADTEIELFSGEGHFVVKSMSSASEEEERKLIVNLAETLDPKQFDKETFIKNSTFHSWDASKFTFEQEHQTPIKIELTNSTTINVMNIENEKITRIVMTKL